MLRQTTDEFDAFRRDRKKAKARLGPQASVLGYDNAALRELEEVEAREVREQQLSREVHDFFAAATKQAATIVEKVAQDAEQEVDVRLQDEMRGFLVDAMARMNTFVVSTLQREGRAGVAETQIEPDVKRLVGPDLDGFRYEGSAAASEAHIGQDPFATAVEDVQAEFRQRVEGLPDPSAPAASAPGLVVPELEAGPEERQASEPAASSETGEARVARDEGCEVTPPAPASTDDDQFRSALKALVRQGVMQPEEAQAAWRARVGRDGDA